VVAVTCRIQQQQQQGCSRTSGASAGVSDVQRAALCIVAAPVRAGDPEGWALQDVLTALNAVVAAAGPGMLSQGDLLVSIISLYSMVSRTACG